VRRSIRNQIVGLVGAMLIASLATYLFLADRVVAADKLKSMRDSSDLIAATAADAVNVSLDAVADKLRYFGAQRPDPDAVFDAEDQLLALHLFEKNDTGWRQSLSHRAPGAPEAVETVPVPAGPQLQAAATVGVVVLNVSLPQLPIARVLVALPDGRVATGDFKPARLLPPAAHHGVYSTYLVDGSGQVIAHPDEARIVTKTDLSGRGIVRDALKSSDAVGGREYDEASSKQVWVGSWARPKLGQLVVIAEAPREDAFKATTELTRRALLWGSVMILVAVALSGFFARRVSRPLRDLENTIQRVSRGELGAEVEVQTADEIGSLAQSFNQMSRELARRSQELDVKNAQLVQSEKMSAIGELSAGLAHEVKNPMVGIVGFAQLGQESTSLDEAREYFKLIDNDAQRANGILQNLLEFARPPDVETETLDFNQVVEAAVKLTAHQLQLNGVKVQTTYAPEVPKIRGNGNQLRQVLLNLMMNASQAMEGQDIKRLYVETKGGDAGAQVSVRDVGPGIAPEAQARLFEPFFTTKPRGKGTGLGLSVSRSIIEAHRGEIRVESELGKGATFFIRLPAASAMEEASGPFKLGKELSQTRH
jgi:signal transduction histidine kinase